MYAIANLFNKQWVSCVTEEHAKKWEILAGVQVSNTKVPKSYTGKIYDCKMSPFEVQLHVRDLN